MNNAQIKAALQNLSDNCRGIEVFFVDQEDTVFRSDIRNEELDGARTEFVEAIIFEKVLIVDFVLT